MRIKSRGRPDAPQELSAPARGTSVQAGYILAIVDQFRKASPNAADWRTFRSTLEDTLATYEVIEAEAAIRERNLQKYQNAVANLAVKNAETHPLLKFVVFVAAGALAFAINLLTQGYFEKEDSRNAGLVIGGAALGAYFLSTQISKMAQDNTRQGIDASN
jgi:hypothetical protein